MNKEQIIKQMVDKFASLEWQQYTRDVINETLSNPELMEAAGWVRKEELNAWDELHDYVSQCPFNLINVDNVLTKIQSLKNR